MACIVHPITFKKSIITKEINAYTELIQKIKSENFRVNQNSIDGLKKFNDFVYKKIIEDRLWDSIPSDTRFPGYFSSLAEHAVATTSIAVPLAVEVFKKGFDFASEYDANEIKDVLSTERGIIEVFRLLSLLHDVGKHPPEKHHVRTREYVEKVLKNVGLNSFSKILAESASRHHYRATMDKEYQPQTKLEWIVAFADKVSSAQERGISGEFTNLLEPYRWLLKVEDGKENIEKISKIVEFVEGVNLRSDVVKNYINDKIIYTSIPVNFSEIQKIDDKIFNASHIINNAKVGVFGIEVAGIQKFITASDYKKYISGASALIDDALNEAKTEIEKMLCPECIIYAKGGSLLAIIPPNYFEKIKGKISRIFGEKTKVVRLKMPKIVGFELWELKYGPKVYKIDDAEIKTSLKLAEKRNFGSVVSSVIDSLETTEEIGHQEIIRIGEICPVCHEYRKSRHEHLIDGKKEKVCVRCHLAIEEDENLRGKEIYIINLKKDQPEVEIPIELKPDVSYTRIIKKVKETLESKLKNNPVVSNLKSKGVNKVIFAPVKTWDCLGRQHLGKDYSENCNEVYDIAFIKGDGDNFGKIKSSMPSITLYRQISKMFETVIEDTIAESLSEIMIKQLEIRLERKVGNVLILELPFDIVFVGGDDFLVIIDAAFIFIFLMAFRKRLQKILGERKSEFDKKENEPLSIVPLGVSMGIAVVKNRMPIKSTLYALDELLHISKQRSKSEADGFGGEIFVSMKKFDSIPTKDEVKKVFGGTIKYTQFPMSGRELIDFIEDLKFFAQKGVSPNWIEGVFGDMSGMYDAYKNEPNQMKKSPLDFYVNLLYRMARADKGTEEWEVLERIEHMHRDELKHVKEKFVFKHIDIAESLEIITGKLSENLPAEKCKEITLKLLGG